MAKSDKSDKSDKSNLDKGREKTSQEIIDEFANLDGAVSIPSDNDLDHNLDNYLGDDLNKGVDDIGGIAPEENLDHSNSDPAFDSEHLKEKEEDNKIEDESDLDLFENNDDDGEFDDNFDFEEDDSLNQVDEHTVVKDRPQKGSPVEQLIDLVKQNWIYAIAGVGVVIFGWYMVSNVLGLGSSSNKPVHRVERQQVQPSGFFGPSSTHRSEQNAIRSFGRQDHQNHQNLIKENTRSRAPGASQISNQSMDNLLKGVNTLIQSGNKKLESKFSDQLKNLNTEVMSTMRGQNNIIEHLDSAYNKEKAQNLKLSKHLNKLDAQMVKLNTAFKQYNTTIKKLSSNLTVTQKELELVLAERTQNMKKYTLRAVVPGQAWLVGANGVTKVVSVGSHLGNYGTVSRIDNADGKVYMSSGYVFS